MRKLALALGLFAVGASAAAPDESAIQSTFVKPWIEALRSKDAARIRQFTHPLVRACATESTKLYFDYLSNNELSLAVTGAYEVTSVTALTGPAPLLMLPADGFAYTVQPKYQVQIDFKETNLSAVRWVAASNGRWFEVFPCPNEKGIAFLREKMNGREEQVKKAEYLAAAIREPLLSELKTALAGGQKIAAIKKYQQAAGVDLTTAVMVIDALQQPGR
jgi:hypothetical protein